jgi:uncharacterized membrane protein
MWRWILSVGVSLAWAGPALADLTMCNKTDIKQTVAIGYKDDQGKWASEGWWGLHPEECKRVLAGDLERQYYYYRVTNATGAWSGEYAFCTDSKPFTIVGDEDCASRGFESARFSSMDVGEARSFTLNLTGSYAKSEAPPRDQVEPPFHNEDVSSSWSAPLGPNALGEPFSQSGVFTGCDLIDGYEFCAFEAEGWRYFAGYGDGTDVSLLEKIETLDIGEGVEFSGVISSYGDITVNVALSHVKVYMHPHMDLYQMMQGRWRSLEDPRSEFEIVGARVYNYYDGEFLGEDLMRFVDQCEGAPYYLGWERIDLETQDRFCVMISNVSDTEIELTNPGRGNLLIYTRKW